MLAGAVVALVRLYQLTLGRLLPGRCRFHPSCSRYAIDALRGHGFLRGAGLAVWRVLRCGPWTEGGLDPVPAGRRPAGTGVARG